MHVVWYTCCIFLLFAHTAVGFLNVKTISHKTVKVSPGQAVLITCPARRLDADDMVTWEAEDGEFLSLGEDYLAPSVTRSVIFVCRRRSLKSGAMISAEVCVNLAQRLQADEEYHVRRFGTTSIKCIDFPKSSYTYEWVNPKEYQVSRDNVLRIQLIEDADFGIYLCRPFSDRGPLPVKEVDIREDTRQLTTVAPSRLEDLVLKIASGGMISALCLPPSSGHPRDVSVRWFAPNGSVLKAGNRLTKRAHERSDFGTYSCEATSQSGSVWLRKVVVRNIASRRSANILQNDWSIWNKKKEKVTTTFIPTTTTATTTTMSFTTPVSSTRNRPTTTRPRRTEVKVTHMKAVKLNLDLSAAQRVACPNPGHLGRYPGFTQSRVYWTHSGRNISNDEILERRQTRGLFGEYECWRIYRNNFGDIRKIVIPVIFIEKPTPTIEQYATKTTSQPTRRASNPVTRVYELAPQTIKVLKNETVMLVCPTEASISSNRPLTSLRHIWRGQHGIIGRQKFLFSSTNPSTKTETKFSCQHDFIDPDGREISLFKNFTLRLQSDQVELPVGERQDIYVVRSSPIRLMCVTDEKEGDNYEWIHPSGQSVSSMNELDRVVVDDVDFGEYRCTVWRADGTSELRTVRVNEKFPQRARTITKRRFEWLRLRCMESPPPRAKFEWVHPKQIVVSRENDFLWHLKDAEDFGHYVCRTRSPSRILPPSDFMVLEYPVTPSARPTLYPDIIYRRQGDMISLRCWDSPKPETIFEWVHPNSFIVSRTNLLRWQIKKETDFGHYVCHAFWGKVHARTRHTEVLKMGGGNYHEPKKGAVFLRRNEMTFFKCVEQPQGNFLYEWTNPQGYVVSQKNVLRIQLLEDSDFGHYVCRAISELGRVRDRDVFIEEDKIERLTTDPMIPEKIMVYKQQKVNITCVDNPPPQTMFEWLDEAGYKRSSKNILSLTITGDRDLGKFTCQAFATNGPLPSRTVIIILKPIEKIMVDKQQTVNVTCVENPPPQTMFEWLDEAGYRRSSKNILSLTITGDRDLGKFTCQAFATNGPLPSRTVIITLKPMGLKLSPESGILTACIGQASASAMCWLENRRITPVWRNLRNNSRVKTNVLSGRHARLALYNVDSSDDGRVFECMVRSLGLARRVTVKVEGVCETCVCLPTEIKCEAVNGRRPPTRCISANWMCDGEDDCGNGFDESNCPYRLFRVANGKCEGQTKRCRQSNKIIPTGFWCDGEDDCEQGDDESFCQPPQVISPNRLRRVEVVLGQSISLKCVSFGVPPPKLIWRFNWDCLPPGFSSSCYCNDSNTNDSNGYTVDCTLSTQKVQRHHLGIFTCEAINSRGRAFAEDYHMVLKSP